MLKYFKCLYSSLIASVYVVGAYANKAHPLALKKYGIRIVAVTDDHQQREDLSNGAYSALTLLEQYDEEKFIQVKKHIRIIALFSTHSDACYVPTGALYFINTLRFPVAFSKDSLPTAIAGFLVGQATLASLGGGTAHFDRVNGREIIAQCRDENFRTQQRINEGIASQKIKPTRQP